MRPSDVLNTRPIEELRAHRRDRLRTYGIAVQGLPVSKVTLHEPEDAPLDTSVHWPEPEDDDGPPNLTAPLDDAMRSRVQAFMEGGGDPQLEAALAASGKNPLQAAFDLLFG